MFGWRVIVTFSLTLQLITAKPSLLPGDPRLNSDDHHDHHHDHHHNDHHHHEHHHDQQPEQSQVAHVTPYVLNPDGTYAFRYQLTDGSFAYVNGQAGFVSGGYGYKSQDGQDIQLQYTAGPNGFRPVGAHLPAIPEVPTGSANEDYDYTANTYTANNDDYYDEDADRSYNFGFQANGYNREETADSQGNVQGQYSYTDSDGIFRQLSYHAGAGIGFVAQGDHIPQPVQPVEVNVKSQSAPSLPIATKSQEEQTFSGYADLTPPNPVKLHQRKPQAPSQLYAAPAQPPKAPNQLYGPPEIKTEKAPQPQTTTTTTTTPAPMMMDASYSFDFNSADSARREESDPNGNVRGQYSYVNAEGKTILVRYRAGANTGFVIENEEELTKSVDEATRAEPKAQRPVQPYANEQVHIQYQAPEVNMNDWTIIPNYSFGYQSSQGSRNEESDADGKVRGSYTIPGPNGREIVVRYVASAETGFVIENLDEVMAASVPTEDNQNIQPKPESPAVIPILRNQNQQYQSNTKSSSSQFSHFVAPQQQFVTPVIRNSPPQPVQPVQSNVDRSYSFQYDGQSGRRQETADQHGNVRGQYSYVNAEGNEILVTYSATPNGGFVIENEEELTKSVEKATLDGARAAAAFKTSQHRQNQERTQSNVKVRTQQTRFSGNDRPEPVDRSHASANNVRVRVQQNRLQTEEEVIAQPLDRSHASPSNIGHQTRRRKVVRKVARRKNNGYSIQNPAQTINIPNQLYDTPKPQTTTTTTTTPAPMMMDQSFQFGYSSAELGQEEVSDVNGERTGSYRYVNPDGKTVVVRYRAGINGFQILNPDEVLPKAPTA